VAAAFTLAACAGGSVPTTPNVQGVNQAVSTGASFGTPAIAPLNAQPTASCPSQFTAGCTTVSQKNGAVLRWCIGKGSNPCSKSQAAKYSWSGVVCDAKGKTCKKPIKQLTAKWSGPFKCKKKDNCKGTYELDTLTPGPGLKATKKYVYKQDVHICAGKNCKDYYLGINVSK
jgi:hypothetical protein